MTSSAVANALSKKMWEEHEPIPDPAQVDAARKRMHSANSLLRSVVAREVGAIVHTIPTSGAGTLAVTLLPDGFVAQLFNPTFVLSLEKDEDLAFVRTHEIYHLLMRHLWGDRDMKGDDVYNMAQEATINERVQRLMMGTADLPPSKRMMPRALDEEKGTYVETGVNPFKTWERYRKDLKEQGLTPVGFSEFYASDLRCYAEMKRMTKPIPRGGSSKCETGQNMSNGGGSSPNNNPSNQQGGGGEPGSSQPDPTVDPGMLKEVVERGLEQTVRKAQDEQRSGSGNTPAKNEISDLMDMPDQDDSISTMWGDIGANQLRGKATETKKVEFWKQYLQEALHTRLVDGERLVYNQAIWWEPRLSRKGDEECKKIVIAVDTSGSMQTSVINYIVDLLGDEDELEIAAILAFDTTVYPLESVGDSLRGGGGTDPSDISKYVDEELGGDVDALIVVTDGYFPHVAPAWEPDRWIWLITPGGDGQGLEDLGMSVYDLDMEHDA